MLHYSHMSSTPGKPWEGSPAAGQPPTWPLPSPPGGYWLPTPAARYWPSPTPADHPGQSFTTPLPCSGQGYWLSPPLAPPAAGQAPVWEMPLWTTPTVSHLGIYF
jgi:hypothetical protein